MVFRNSWSNFDLKQLVTALATSVIYAAISTLLDPDRTHFVEEDAFGDIRPAIFFPALVAILYGPIVGGLGAGIGNFLYDLIGVILNPDKTLELKHLIGFMGNLLGGFIVGGLSKPYEDVTTMFDQSRRKSSLLKELFNLKFIRRIVRNTLSSIIGLGFVTGIVIGYGQRINPEFPRAASFTIFSNISYWNSVFLMGAIPLLYLLITIIDYFQDKKSLNNLERRRHIQMKRVFSDFSVSDAVSPIGDELFQNTWGSLKFSITNKMNKQTKYNVRISSDDIFSPHQHQTPLLDSQESDELYFNVFGISSGEKKAKVIISEENSIEEKQIEFTYDVGSTTAILIEKLMSILFIMGFIVSTLIVVANLRTKFTLNTTIIMSLL
ncbi:MAG: ECF transporter S component, partial [Candidatus Heimdallarchaeota archaeon]|nr:ECF transporter S component [Candidatus Heimdallarchaeota archaeon]